MQTINVYPVMQHIEVQFAGNFNLRTRNRDVYSPNIKLYKNTANPVRLLIKNQDQKPIEIAGFNVIVDLCDASDNSIVERYTAEVVNAAKGICKITVLSSTLNVIESQYHYFTVKKQAINTVDVPAYIDDNYSVKLPVEVLDGYLPYDETEIAFDLGLITEVAVPLLDLGSING
jgi:hypothetical protein